MSLNPILRRGWIAMLCAAWLLPACSASIQNSSTLTPTGAPSLATPALTPGAFAPSPITPTPTSPSVAKSEETAIAQTPSSLALAQRSVINVGNVKQLGRVGQLSQSGARLFTWLDKGGALVIAAENELEIYSLQTAQRDQAIPARAVRVTASQDRPWLAWADPENRVHLWDTQQQKEIHTFEEPEAAVTSLAFSPGGSLLACSSYDGKIFIWDTSGEGLKLQWKNPSWYADLSFSPDGKQIGASDHTNFSVQTWDAATGQALRSLSWQEHASPALYSATFSPDWTRLAWVARGTIQLMDVASGNLGATIEHEDAVSGITWSPDSPLLASAAGATLNGEFTPAVLVWDANSGEQIAALAQDSPVIDLSFSPDGRRLASLLYNGTLQFWAVEP